MEFLTHINIVRVPQARQMKILESVRIFLEKTSVSARDFLSLLGQLNAAADFVMLGRLHLRPLQISLHKLWQPQNFPLDHQIGLTTKILQHLKWWLQEDLYPHEDRSSLPHHLYRCQPVRLGSSCGTGGTSVSWTMDRRPIPAPYQCARDESNSSLSNTSNSQGKEFHCIGVNGQHYSGSLYKASGRDSFHSSHRGGVEHPEFVPNSQHTAVSETHTGQVQHSSGPDVSERQTDLHRVVPESGNSKQDFPDHGLSINRPVCHTSEPQAAIICVTHTGSEGAINQGFSYVNFGAEYRPHSQSENEVYFPKS